jgi:hypothetical protein
VEGLACPLKPTLLIQHDIIVDNKSATGNNKNTLFLLNNKYVLKKGHWGDFCG